MWIYNHDNQEMMRSHKAPCERDDSDAIKQNVEIVEMANQPARETTILAEFITDGRSYYTYHILYTIYTRAMTVDPMSQIAL